MVEESKYTIDVKEASEILDISKKTIYKRLRAGELDGKKLNIKNGQKWFINEDEIKEISILENEIVDVQEIDKPIAKEDLMNELIEAVNRQNKELIDKAMNNVSEQIKQQNEVIQSLSEENKEIKEEIKKMRKEQDKSIWERVKEIF